MSQRRSIRRVFDKLGQHQDSHRLAESISAMNRRGFVRTATGLLVGAGLGCGETTIGVTDTGTLEIRITGLNASAPNGGTATGTLTGQPPVTVTLPVSGVGSAVVPVGSYQVNYAAPTGFQLVAGSTNPQTAVVTANATSTVSFTVQASGGGGSGTISGVIRAGSTPVGGGIIQLRSQSGATVVDTKVPSGAGAYSFTGVVAGTYRLYLHPPLGYSLDPSEPGAQSGLAADQINVTVSGAGVIRDIALKQSMWEDDFTGYADSTALKSGSAGFAKARVHEGSTSVIQENPSQITLEPTAGPTGGKVMRYTFPNRSGSSCGSNYVINQRGFYNTPPAQSSDIWIRFHEKLSSNWKNYQTGSPGPCTSAASYKHLLVNFGTLANFKRIGMFWNFIPPSMFIQVDDSSNTFELNPGPSVAGDEGQWTTYVVHYSGLGSTNCRVRIYKNGVVTAAWATCGPGTFLPPGGEHRLIEVAFGFNINDGPSQVQTREFAEVGVYRARPSMIHGLAV